MTKDKLWEKIEKKFEGNEETLKLSKTGYIPLESVKMTLDERVEFNEEIRRTKLVRGARYYSLV